MSVISAPMMVTDVSFEMTKTFQLTHAAEVGAFGMSQKLPTAALDVTAAGLDGHQKD